jgi:hypothetical protein
MREYHHIDTFSCTSSGIKFIRDFPKIVPSFQNLKRETYIYLSLQGSEVRQTRVVKTFKML